MIIPKNELKAETAKYIKKTIEEVEDYVAKAIIKASAEGEYKVFLHSSDTIPMWALGEVGKKYQDEGYIVEFLPSHCNLWIVLDDEEYKKQKERDSKRDWGWDL